MKPRLAPPSQQQLSLFGEPEAQAPAALPDTPLFVPSPLVASAPATPAAAPVAPPSGLTPAVFRHPQADREIRLREHLVSYALKRGRRRSIGFVVGVEGLSVSAPRWVGVGEIEAALREKANWILKKLHEQQDRGQRLQAAKVEWRDGTSIPFLGETVIVVLDARTTGAVLNTDAESLPGVPRLTLHIGLPHTATPEQIRDAVQSWLQRQARRVFEERCRLFTERLGVRYTRLSLSSAQTRWGSASADGSIRLNWRLIHFALHTIDYVVAHELAHLREMNHSPRFWDVVRSVVPDFERARGVLKDDVLPVFD
jgi:predicted metal-dependent hydrolase